MQKKIINVLKNRIEISKVFNKTTLTLFNIVIQTKYLKRLYSNLNALIQNVFN